MDDNIIQRRELGNFLKTRREKIRPSQVGLPDSTRRRTPGLRREEVALLAGVSVTWYTWLEQGRSIKVSDEVMHSIARALMLNSHEIAYIFELSQSSLRHNISGIKTAHSIFQNVLDSLVCSPSTMMDKYWNVIAWNKAANAVFVDFDELDVVNRNIIQLMFTNEKYQSLFPDWPTKAKKMLAVFRVSCAEFINDQWLKEFVGSLQAKSKYFQQWWPLHNVAAEQELKKIIRHPTIGKLYFEHTVFLTPENNFKIYINTPATGTKTKEKIEKLLNVQQKNI